MLLASPQRQRARHQAPCMWTAAQVLPSWSRLLADHDVLCAGSHLNVCVLTLDLMGDGEVAKLWPLRPRAARMMSAFPWGTANAQHCTANEQRFRSAID